MRMPLPRCLCDFADQRAVAGQMEELLRVNPPRPRQRLKRQQPRRRADQLVNNFLRRAERPGVSKIQRLRELLAPHGGRRGIAFPDIRGFRRCNRRPVHKVKRAPAGGPRRGDITVQPVPYMDKAFGGLHFIRHNRIKLPAAFGPADISGDKHPVQQRAQTGAGEDMINLRPAEIHIGNGDHLQPACPKGFQHLDSTRRGDNPLRFCLRLKAHEASGGGFGRIRFQARADQGFAEDHHQWRLIAFTGGDHALFHGLAKPAARRENRVACLRPGDHPRISRRLALNPFQRKPRAVQERIEKIEAHNLRFANPVRDFRERGNGFRVSDNRCSAAAATAGGFPIYPPRLKERVDSAEHDTCPAAPIWPLLILFSRLRERIILATSHSMSFIVDLIRKPPKFEDISYFTRAILSRPWDIPGILRREAARRRSVPWDYIPDPLEIMVLREGWPTALKADMFRAPPGKGPKVTIQAPVTDMAATISSLQFTSAVDFIDMEVDERLPWLSLEAARLGLKQSATSPEKAASARAAFVESEPMEEALRAELRKLAAEPIGAL